MKKYFKGKKLSVFRNILKEKNNHQFFGVSPISVLKLVILDFTGL